jgi:hypothetical protein
VTIVPKRTFWLTTGVVVGAGASLWTERRVRRAIDDAAARLQPDALALEASRRARGAARATGDRIRSAVSEAKEEMRRHEGELWGDLERNGKVAAADRPAATGPPAPAPAPEPVPTGMRVVSRRTLRTRRLRRSAVAAADAGGRGATVRDAARRRSRTRSAS